jgi:hypothetical protein
MMLALVMSALLTRIPSQVKSLTRSLCRHAIHDCLPFLACHSNCGAAILIGASRVIRRPHVGTLENSKKHSR